MRPRGGAARRELLGARGHAWPSPSNRVFRVLGLPVSWELFWNADWKARQSDEHLINGGMRVGYPRGPETQNIQVQVRKYAPPEQHRGSIL